MSTEAKQKTKAEKRAAALKALRVADGFLPKYSDFYFEKKKNIHPWKYVFGYVLVILFSDSLLDNFDDCFLTIMLCYIIALFLYHNLITVPVRNRRQKCGARLEEYGIVKTTFFGEKAPIPYSRIEQAVSSGDICYGSTGLRIGHGSGKLVFHYEIGDSKAQTHMEECHALLQKHLTSKLPPFEKKGLDLLDRKYFYKKAQRNQTFSLLGAFLFFCSMYCTGMRTISGSFFLACIFGPWECSSLYSICKSGKLAERNHVFLKKEFADYPAAGFGWHYAGYAYAVLAAIVLTVANFLILMKF